jgi:hypothetical protein
VNNADSEIVNLCSIDGEVDIGCVIDGETLGIEAAEGYLQDPAANSDDPTEPSSTSGGEGDETDTGNDGNGGGDTALGTITSNLQDSSRSGSHGDPHCTFLSKQITSAFVFVS